MSATEPYIHELYLVGLSIEEFSAVMNFYGTWVEQTWFERPHHGIKLTNMPLLATQGLYDTVEQATKRQPVGVPTDDRQ